jgi:hypothetical protein
MAQSLDVFSDPWFRCIFIVGAAVRDRRREIFDATDIQQRETWLYAIDIIEAECESARSKGIIPRDPDFLVKRVRDQLAATSKTYTAQPALSAVLERIAADIRPLKNKQILTIFADINQRAFNLTRRCVSRWGGAHAKARLDNFQLTRLLYEDCDAKGPKTVVPTWTGPDEDHDDDEELFIHIVLGGGQKPLLGCLCLEFYLFHEYLSHVFPVHEDTAGSLSEGYLFKIARWWYLLSEDVPMSSALVEVDWASHWERQKIKASADSWNLLHQQTEWFEVNSSRSRFAWVILELAAYAEDQKYRFQARFLGFLRLLYRTYDTVLAAQLLNGSSTQMEEVHDLFEAALEPKVNQKALVKIRGRQE